MKEITLHEVTDRIWDRLHEKHIPAMPFPPSVLMDEYSISTWLFNGYEL